MSAAPTESTFAARLWEHPDNLPNASDLDDPDGFVHREQLDFSELDRMLGEAADGKPDLRKRAEGDAGAADGAAANGPASPDGPDGPDVEQSKGEDTTDK